MRDSNKPLRIAYVSKLSTPAIEYNGEEVPVWYVEAPPTETAKNYIVIGAIDNTDVSTKNSDDTSTTIRVTIHTHDEVMNDGDAADVIAGEVMNRIRPADHSQLDLSGSNLQIVSTDIAGDNLNDYDAEGAKKYIDRTLTFRHYIFQR